MQRRTILGSLAAGACILVVPLALADAYPAKSIRIVVGYPPGAQSDVTARLVGIKLAELLGQPVVIENRSGASGIIAAELVAHGPADGYTLLLGGSSNLSLAPLFVSDLRYDPVRDFVPIGGIARVPLTVAVTSRLPVRTLQQLFDYARAHSGDVTYGSSSVGTQLAGHILMTMAGAVAINVPYKGTAPAVADVVAGRLDFTLADASALAPFIPSGKLRLVATTGERRLRDAPDIPTVAELGYPDFSAYSWSSLVAPRDTPRAVIATLRSAMRQVTRDPELRESLPSKGFEPFDNDPESMAALLKAEIDRLRPVVKQSGIRLELQ